MASTGTLIFETVIADFLKVIPNVPVKETWEWKTDIIQAHDGTEQRISLRSQPRRRLEYGILLEDENDRRREYQRLFQYLSGTVYVPYYQYHTYITQDSAISATKIFFDRDKTDFRDNDFAIVFRSSTSQSFLIPLSIIDIDGGNTTTPLTNAINTGDIVAPAFLSYLDNRIGPRMGTVSGQFRFQLNTVNARSQFNRPESTASIATFDSLNVLDRKPLARSMADEIFDIQPSVIDNETGIIGRNSSLLHAIVSGRRQFRIPRHQNPVEMDYWRDFLTVTVGMREPFLFPTWRQDLVLKTTPSGGDPQILVEGAEYETQYFAHDTFKRFQFENSAGSIEYRKATAVTPQPGGDTLITLDTPVTNDPAWSEKFDISYLNKVRMSSDRVVFNHQAIYSIVNLSVRNTDQ